LEVEDEDEEAAATAAAANAIVSSSFTIPPFIFLKWKLNLSAMQCEYKYLRERVR